ncbi:hypothetical protein Gocc_2122 [Gaiella occulta]|uniref:Uncharacterized protein n=1 Tax=Gaiella occulta TaxID=1002870 RepID=A0A7M2YVH4_9ACTN|nr:hypothetical protein [Gaiella occulta]RDI74025.1 hypothetical protein Gocc_2122 [Gaiella occulta]
MIAILHSVRHPEGTGPGTLASSLRSFGVAVGLMGVALIGVTLIADLTVAAGSGSGRAQTLAWSFGLTTAGLVMLKTALALTLVGILLRITDRIEAVKASLPALAPAAAQAPAGAPDADTVFGRATRTAAPLGPLPIHTMARRMWGPMVLVGPMLVLAGLVLSIIQAGTDGAADFADLGASIIHLVVAATVNGGSTSLADSDKWFVVLEGVRRIGVALYLFAILLGLATISRVLLFQTARVRELPDEQPAER